MGGWWYPKPSIVLQIVPLSLLIYTCLMGAERDGLTPGQKAPCDSLIYIPMVGRSDSLNLAVAAGVVLYEIFYQTRHGQLEGAAGQAWYR